LVFPHRVAAVASLLSFLSAPLNANAQTQFPTPPQKVFGYADFSAQSKIDAQFMAVPEAKLAGEHLKTLTSAPHVAGSKEDHDTAEYVAKKFKEAGLDTEIVEYRVLLNRPKDIKVTATDASGKQLMSGPTPEHVDNDPFQDDPRVLPAFNGSSASGDVTGDVVYANYGSPADYKKLDEMHIDVKGKIVLVRYGSNFRGVKVYVAQQHGAAGVIIYSDPADDGYVLGDKYPHGPMRPDSAVQRGAVQFLPIYPGDTTTPSIPSTLDLPESKRTPMEQAGNQPKIPATPLSYKDASPILENIGGPDSPREWQGGLPFTYHVGGANAVKVHLRAIQEYKLWPIWDVIGKIPGTEDKDSWVVAGNHRDAWVYGAVDPNSGTAAMLESVHGVGALLRSGWRPKRTIVFASWDAEEYGLIGSTEWVEQHPQELQHAVAYFNMDVGVAGPDFGASAVPTLKPFIRDVTREVPSPKGGSVYDQWRESQKHGRGRGARNACNEECGVAKVDEDVRVGDLGSGSDYTPFIQHTGVPSADMGSSGPYGVYHSVFDNYAWFTMNADPTFVYLQQQARVFGLEVLHMANADVLPYDYELYGKEIQSYLTAAQKKAKDAGMQSVDFSAADTAARRLTQAGSAVKAKQLAPTSDMRPLNQKLRATEAALIYDGGLPHRPWFKHVIFDPGEYTGYAAVVIPGVNEGIDAEDVARTNQQMQILTAALNRAAEVLESAK
jgi:N-acetylated-alpha-linked acidic dipeptidase